MSRRRTPGLSPQDAALWARVARDVRPLPGRERAPAQAKRRQTAQPQAAQKALKTSAAPKTAPMASGASSPAPRPPAPADSVPLSARQHRQALAEGGTLDRRTRRRLVRGQVEIEARLDLHGFSAQEAHMRLRAFIARARGQGLRTVLVITGKGGASALSRHTLHGYAYHHAPERAGRLRQLLPQWLSEADMAEHVAGWQPAHPRHGGGGAFYIRLRRRRG